LDDEILAAIESLSSSTAAIEAQTAVLRSQTTQLASILQSEKDDDRRRANALDNFRMRHTKEVQRMALAV
jgi:molecular chaperone GrpE (heat shock protein)